MRCPKCRSNYVDVVNDDVACNNCGHVWRRSEQSIKFRLLAWLRRVFS